MGEGKTRYLQDLWSAYGGRDHMKKKDTDMIINEDDCRTPDDHTASSSLSSSIGDDDSTISNGSSSWNDDTRDDASSTATCSSSSNSSGALYDLSELMAQLPIKRGLSQYYHGKSDSFTCLSRVRSIEDLAKKEAAPYRRKNKGSKNREGGLDAYKLFTLPRPVISKKTSRVSPSNSRTRSFINTNSRPPQIPFQKGFNGASFS